MNNQLLRNNSINCITREDIRYTMLKSPSSIECLGFTIFGDSFDKLPRINKTLISTINQYSYCIAKKENAFREALANSDVLLPDGIAIVWAARFLYGKNIEKLAGADIHKFLLKKLNRESGSCFYLGSSEETLAKIKERINRQYPNIKIEVYSPPFKPELSADDSAQMIDIVNDFKPDVLFVGMTAPKQEKWSYEHKEQLDTKVICSIGAVFDFYAGTVDRPSKFWRNNGLEWFGRLLKEPKRMWKRYIIYGFIFVAYVLKEKWRVITEK